MVVPHYLRRLILAVSAATASATLVALTPAAADTPAYRATITRTEHDIPHIVAEDWGSLGFGSGYAAAETSICTLADTVLAARGERSKYLGPDAKYDDQVAMNGTNLQVDALVTDLHNREVVEKLLAGDHKPSPRAMDMVAGYAEGVNEYLRDIGGADGITDPKCKGADYIEPNATALDLWYGVYLANIIASTGNFLKEIVDADPPSLDDPGLPSVINDAVFGLVPEGTLDLSKLGNDLPIGSNATAIGKDATSTGRGMILGNPHFPWRGRFRFTQQHLTGPGGYDVAGGSLIGSPAVNIGWNKDVAWSHTVSTAYRFTPYEYRTVGSPTTYLYQENADDVLPALKNLEHREVQIEAKQSDGSIETVTEDLYRTNEGYVLDAPDIFMGWTPLSFFAIRDANGEQLRTIDTFLDMGGASDVNDLLQRQDTQGGMPWVNTIAADSAGNALYADHSVVPNVPNSMASPISVGLPIPTGGCLTPIGLLLFQQAGLPGLDGTRAKHGCNWRTDADAERPGILGPSNLPKTVRQDWVMNANDSYWLPNPAQKLEGFARIIGCEGCVRTNRSRMVYSYVIDQLADTEEVTPENLRGFEHANRLGAAEAMGSNADLVTVCEAADGGDYCDALSTWDRTSNKGSRGYALFEAFATRMPETGGYKVPFSAADPVNTPRDLDEANTGVIDAMKGALADLRSKNIAPDATWGQVQVAGDDGVDPFPLGGGEGDMAGNANALASRKPVQNTSFGKPITYGSSHIQSIAFTDTGVDAKTILTYGQSENPNRPSHQDQTELFSNQQWVSFPWTDAEIEAKQVSVKTLVVGPDPTPTPTPTPTTSNPPTVVTCGGVPVTMSGGTSGNDTITGTGGNDVIQAFGGNDRVNGGGGNDRICGSDGNDVLLGGGGDDRLYGSAGNDSLSGQDANDVLAGGPGADRLSGGAGTYDRATYTDHTAAVAATIGNSKADDGNSTDGAKGARDNVDGTIEGLLGTPDADALVGNGRPNVLEGRDGNDTLSGLGERDKLDGGNGSDTLRGGYGNDALIGGAHADTFYGDGDSDTLLARDGTRDRRIDGGLGTDKATRDRVDPAAVSVP